MKAGLRPPQIRALEQIEAAGGPIRTGGLNARPNTLSTLERDFLIGYVEGGWLLTEKGRRVLRSVSESGKPGSEQFETST